MWSTCRRNKKWNHRVKPSSDDFTKKQAVAAILRITRGNIRLIERLMMQVEHVLVANQTRIVTKDVVETATEPHHRAELSAAPQMRSLKTVRYIK